MADNTPVSKKSYIAHAAIFLGILLICLIVLNLIFSQITSLRWDLTNDHQFTLSPATVRLIDKLDSPVKLKVFLSKDLPAPDNTIEQRAKDLLDEFEASSHGKISFD